MRLFVHCIHCNNKIYLSSNAKTRQELPYNFEISCASCGKLGYYTSRNVFAESGLTATGGALLGGLLGLAFGGAGALAGAILGGMVGKNSQDQDAIDVSRFNNS